MLSNFLFLPFERERGLAATWIVQASVEGEHNKGFLYNSEHWTWKWVAQGSPLLRKRFYYFCFFFFLNVVLLEARKWTWQAPRVLSSPVTFQINIGVNVIIFFTAERFCAFRMDYQPYFSIIFTNSVLWYPPEEIFTSFYKCVSHGELKLRLCSTLPLSGVDSELSGH